MSFGWWALLIGTFMVTMVVAGTMLGRFAMTSALVYLALWLLVPPPWTCCARIHSARLPCSRRRGRRADHFALRRRHAAGRPAGGPTLVAFRQTRPALDGRHGRHGGGYRRVVAALASGCSGPAGRRPRADRPSPRVGHALPTRHLAGSPARSLRRSRAFFTGPG